MKKQSIFRSLVAGFLVCLSSNNVNGSLSLEDLLNKPASEFPKEAREITKNPDNSNLLPMSEAFLYDAYRYFYGPNYKYIRLDSNDTRANTIKQNPWFSLLFEKEKITPENNIMVHHVTRLGVYAVLYAQTKIAAASRGTKVSNTFLFLRKYQNNEPDFNPNENESNADFFKRCTDGATTTNLPKSNYPHYQAIRNGLISDNFHKNNKKGEYYYYYNDHSPLLKNLALSCGTALINNEFGESALDYFSRNRNVTSFEDLAAVIDKSIENITPHLSTEQVNQFKEAFNRLKLQNSAWLSITFTDQNLFDSCAYISESFGNKQTITDKLNKEILNPSEAISLFRKDPLSLEQNPKQVRIIADPSLLCDITNEWVTKHLEVIANVREEDRKALDDFMRTVDKIAQEIYEEREPR